MPKLIDLTGQKYGRLTVIEKMPPTKSGKTRWSCQCTCGKMVIVHRDNLIKGLTKSCGCLKKEINHGKSNTRLFRIWNSMKTRCYNPNHKYYSRYGGRNISICDEWKNSFLSFYAWSITSGYNDSLSIDRIDRNGNYCPQNCRWATPKEQQNNCSHNRMITYNGKTQTLKQWSDELGIKYVTLLTRLNRYNWEIEKALIPPKK